MKKPLYRSLFVGAMTLLLHGCIEQRPVLEVPSSPLMPSVAGHNADYYINRAKDQPTEERQRLLLAAADRLLAEGMESRSLQILTQIGQQPLTPAQELQRSLLLSQLALNRSHGKQALRQLAQITDPKQLSASDYIRYRDQLANAYRLVHNPLDSIRERIMLSNALQNAEAKQANYLQLWQTLRDLPMSALNSYLAEPDLVSPQMATWLQLALYNRQWQSAPHIASRAIARWRKTNPNHPGNQFLPTQVVTKPGNSTQKIALLLPLQERLSGPGKAIRDGFMQAYFQSPRRGQTAVAIYNTSGSRDLSSVYNQALKEGATTIVGPLDKHRVRQLKRLSHDKIPVLALNEASGGSPHAHFYQFGLVPQDEAQQVAIKAHQDGHHRALIIAPAGKWGKSVVAQFKLQWQAQQDKVVAEMTYHGKSDLPANVRRLLQLDDSAARRRQLSRATGVKLKFIPRRRKDFDMIFLVANPVAGRQIMPLLRYYYAGNVPTYATSLIFTGTANDRRDRDIEGVRFCEMPWIANHTTATSQSHIRYPRLYALGLDAYDLMQHLQDFVNYRNFSLHGNTGTLLLDADNRVHRQLVWLQVRGGVPKPLTS